MIPYPPKPTGELEPKPVLRLVLGMACYDEESVGFSTFLGLFKTIMTVEAFNPKGPAFSLSLSTFPLKTNLILKESKSSSSPISSLYSSTDLF